MSKLEKNIPHGIMFHHFHDMKDNIKCQGSLSKRDFANLIKWCEDKKYNILSADTFYNRMLTGTLDDDDVCLTFDDTLISQYEIAKPVLDELGLKAFWFIYTSHLKGLNDRLEIYHHFRFHEYEEIEDFYSDFFSCFEKYMSSVPVLKGKYLEFDDNKYKQNSPFYTYNDKKFRYIRDEVLNEKQYYNLMEKLMSNRAYDVSYWKNRLWMNKEQIRLLYDEGHVIGLHSHTHPTVMNKLSYECQMQEYGTNQKIIESITGIKPDVVAYPCGLYNDFTPSVMNKLGVKAGFIATMNVGDDLLYIPREDSSNIMRKMGGTEK